MRMQKAPASVQELQDLERDLGQGPGVTGQGEWLSTARGQGWMGYWEGIVPWQGGQALAQGDQSSCGCPWIPGSIQVQPGQGLEQPGTVEGVPALSPSSPNHSGNLTALLRQSPKPRAYWGHLYLRLAETQKMLVQVPGAEPHTHSCMCLEPNISLPWPCPASLCSFSLQTACPARSNLS